MNFITNSFHLYSSISLLIAPYCLMYQTIQLFSFAVLTSSLQNFNEVLLIIIEVFLFHYDNRVIILVYMNHFESYVSNTIILRSKLNFCLRILNKTVKNGCLRMQTHRTNRLHFHISHRTRKVREKIILNNFNQI